MTARRIDEDDIVRRALTLLPNEQSEFVRQACAEDVTLLSKVMERLALEGSWPDEILDDAEIADPIGELVGPYKLVRSLGRGGMGEVFLAERADDQFRQQVAVKLVRRGLLSRHIRGRLRSERQILATLDHPNIARLFDGGTTPDGTPYIVMEYIAGEPIDTYCDRNSLTLAQRLKLFQTVCSAVHSAHQSLIVHRDLKPSNILVTADGIPKLLDFGIAKLLDERQLMHTMAVTHGDYRVMTLDHASPEQIRGDPITTASDTYVLGILLYELLTGYKPFAIRGNRFGELERAICEDPPVPPSMMIATALDTAKADVDAIAAARKTSSSKLRRELSGDLDNIILMALRKEPERRYPSVEQLAADVQRYLDGFAVVARSDAWTYRAGKFLRRHAIGVSLATAFVVLLSGFAITTFIQSRQIAEERDRVDRERRVADSQRQRAEQVSSFLVDLFKMSDPAEARGDDITAREILDRGAERITNELRAQPALQATLLDTVGKVYLSLDLKDEAQQPIERALQIRRATFGAQSNEVAESLISLSEVYLRKGDLQQAQHQAEASYRISLDASGMRGQQTAAAVCQLGAIDQLRGELTAAESNIRNCLQIREQLPNNSEVDLTEPLDNLARVLSRRGNYAAAEQIYRRIVEIERHTLGADSLEYARQLHNLATTLYGQRDFAQAETLYRQALAAYRRILKPEHSETIDALSNLGRTLQARGDLNGAEDAYRTALALNRKARGAQHAFVGHDLARLGYLMYVRGKLGEAEQLLREALTIYASTPAQDHGYEAIALMRLGRVLIDAGRPDESEAPLTKSMSMWRDIVGEQSFEFAQAQAYLGLALRRMNQLDRAAELLAASVRSATAARGPDDKDVIDMQSWLDDAEAARRPNVARR